MTSYFRTVQSAVTFGPERGTKADLFAGGQLFVGLNCFEPGQAQQVHAHQESDKFYFLVSGKARMQVGVETRDAAAGELVWAPAGVPHGVLEALDRTVMLVAMAPPPGHRHDPGRP